MLYARLVSGFTAAEGDRGICVRVRRKKEVIVHMTTARSCVIKAFYSALACVFAEVAKRGASAEALVAVLRRKCSVPKAQAASLGKVEGAAGAAKEKLGDKAAGAG